jgi:hypothetical protein
VKQPHIVSRIKVELEICLVELDFQILSAVMNRILSIPIARNQTLVIREAGYDSELIECDK